MKRSIYSFTIIIAFILQGCSLGVENLNDADKNRVLGSREETVSLMKSCNSAYFASLIGSQNKYYDYMADQLTTCSLSSEWPFAKEPRIRIYNDVGGTLESTLTSDWKASYKAIVTANDVLSKIDDWGETDKALADYLKASALTIKGIATGYIGLLYKEGVILDVNKSTDEMEFHKYGDVIDGAVNFLEEAKTIYSSNTDLKWDYLPHTILSSSEIIKVINSYAAKFLLGKARNHAEFKQLDFEVINKYLNNAIEESFSPEGSRELNNSYQYYVSRYSSGEFRTCVDQKIPWLLSGKTAPKKKGTSNLPPVDSPDKRAELYFKYVDQSKFSYFERDPSLYSNYGSVRYTTSSDNRYHAPTRILLLEEVVLMKAETAYGLQNYSLAESILNESNRTKVGELPPLSGGEVSKIADALFYENSIELHLAGKASNWIFMRRWDLLQEGTMLHFAVPGQEAQLLGKEIETIGGQGTGDGIDSASGTNAWR